VCLRILASSRIPRYDLGRQTPHFEVVLSQTATDRRREEAEGQCKHLAEEHTLLWHRGSEFCLTIVGTPPLDPMHEGLGFVASCYTEVVMRLATL
jgi:hypothetical protein